MWKSIYESINSNYLQLKDAWEFFFSSFYFFSIIYVYTERTNIVINNNKYNKATYILIKITLKISQKITKSLSPY